MKRAVAFARNISESKKIAALFERVVEAEIDALDEDSESLLNVEVHHVDGTYNVLNRNKELDWLKQDPGAGNARILSNAKVLSEGVDVPALDAVMFLNARDSVVDVVQSVGRVMRKLEGKNYGYVILPIGVPTDMDPATALNDNKKYKVVWQVLQALRAHDERFDAMVNKIDLTKSTEGKLSVIGVGGGGKDGDKNETGNTAVTLDFPALDQWRDAILAKIVQKVGERRYWENWAKDVAGIASDHMTRIKALVEGSDATLHDEFARFLKGLQDNLNPYITEADAIEMLSQHLITKPVFDALFEGYAFSDHNPVSQVMQHMIDALEEQHLGKETEKLDKFYESVRARAAGVTDAAAKQQIVKELYEKFFQTAFSGTSDRLGIVYTPNEIVDFIIHSVDDALKAEFGASLSDKGIHVLDPFTGTGTFIVRLIQSGLIKPEDLAYKYRYELHANELVLLAYYVAAINIEETYHDLAGSDYVPFEGIVLTDTFQMTEADDELDNHGVFPENNERAEAQKALDIRVIIGNPPWSSGQESANDNNQNLTYKSLDGRISATYAAESRATAKHKLYDSYLRAIRWASDRVGDNGIIAFVSNGSFLEGNSTDGVRRSIAAEFNKIYVLNLRGNARTAGEQRRKEKDSVFGQGTRTTVALYILIKSSDDPHRGQIFYHDIGDYLTRDQKLKELARAGSIDNIDWSTVTPNDHGDWVKQGDSTFESFRALGKGRGGESGVFLRHTNGLVTNRDAWVTNFSKSRIESNMRRTIDVYNQAVSQVASGDSAEVTNDPKQISWTRGLRSSLEKGAASALKPEAITEFAYRPFTKQWLYLDRQWNEVVSLNDRLFPKDGASNYGFSVITPRPGTDFACLALGSVPDLNQFTYTAEFFPRYTFNEAAPDDGLFSELEVEERGGAQRIDNISDDVLVEYQGAFGQKVTKDDIFYYVYGLLHSADYRAQFQENLTKSLPRIPKVSGFWEFAGSGRRLFDLHLDYEAADPYPLVEHRTPGASYRVEKMKYAKSGRVPNKSTVIYNSGITVAGIPDEAHEYMLGSRSAIDWIMERYQIKTDKASGIVNDPNDWAEEQGNPRYVLDLLARIVTVSIETAAIVRSLPPIDVIGKDAAARY